MDNILDPETQRRLAVKSLLENSGFAIFMEEVSELADMYKSELEQHLKSPVSAEYLSKLNFSLGENSGLNRVLLILETLKEELDDSAESKA